MSKAKADFSLKYQIFIANRQRKVVVDRPRLAKVASFVLDCLKVGDDVELSIVLFSDRRMQQLNKQYLDKNRPTDVLAFAQWEGNGPGQFSSCLGDVVISVETAQRQAEEAGVPLKGELDHLIVHGILHLIGYDHIHGKREASVMRRKEKQILKKINESIA